MSVAKEILWEECDFLNTEDEEQETEREDEDEDNSYDDGYPESNSGVIRLINNTGQDIIPTPFGPVNMADASSPIHNTRFFTGHVNFNLSKSVVMAINNTDGVEFLKIMSRYRFLVGVGLMFQPLNVQRAIEKALDIPESDNLNAGADDLDKYLDTTDIQSAIDSVLSSVSKDSKWLAYVLPNGEHIIKIANTDEEFTAKKVEFEQLSQLSSGYVMCYND